MGPRILPRMQYTEHLSGPADPALRTREATGCHPNRDFAAQAGHRNSKPREQRPPQGKTYRLCSPAEILRRRSEAGYLWRFRNHLAVALGQMSLVEKQMRWLTC